MFDELLRQLSLTVSELANLLLKVRLGPAGAGYMISATLPAGSLVAVAPHGLGRSYQGAIITSQSSVNPGLCVLDAQMAERIGYRVADSVVLLTDANASVVDIQVKLWVF